MFGWTFIRKEDLKEYRKAYSTRQAVIQCHRWFSGWKDLDIIWNYLLNETTFGGISKARQDYADARGTDEYGKPVLNRSQRPTES